VGDLLEVLAKRRRSPARSYRSDTHASLPSLHLGPVLPIFPFAPVGITEIVWYVGITIFWTRGLGLPCHIPLIERRRINFRVCVYHVLHFHTYNDPTPLGGRQRATIEAVTYSPNSVGVFGNEYRRLYRS